MKTMRRKKGQKVQSHRKKIFAQLKDRARVSRKPFKDQVQELCRSFGDQLQELKKYLLDRARKRRIPKIFDVTAFLTNLVALMAVFFVSSALADYERRQGLHIASVAAAWFLTAVLFWEGFCLLVRLYDWEKTNRAVRKKGLAFLQTMMEQRKVTVPLLLLALVLVGLCCFPPPQYYASLTEIYGIPIGAGEPLSWKERQHLMGYWKVVDRPWWKHMTLSYQDAYGQVEFMRHYSSAYGMEFFQPPIRIEVDYRFTKKNKEFYRQSGWEAFSLAKSRKFQEPVQIRYYDSSSNPLFSSGKPLLDMKRSGQGLMKIVDYAAEERPQLFNSTLLLFPEEEEENDQDSQAIDVFYGAVSLPTESGLAFQQIETLYNSSGLPEVRRLIPRVYNRYGVNGERYFYDSEGRISSLCYLDVQDEPICNKLGIMTVTFHYDTSGHLTGVRYYSDQGKKEKTEGFNGVFYEEKHYSSDGRLEYRRQMDRNENWCQDGNGVYKYAYGYDEKNGRLIREDFFGMGDISVRNQRFSSSWIEFSLERPLFQAAQAVEVSVESAVSATEEEVFSPVKLNTDLAEQPQLVLLDTLEISPKIGVGAAAFGAEEGDSLSRPEEDRSLEPDEEQQHDVLRRDYTTIRHEFKKQMVCKIRYLDMKGENAANEQGCAEIVLEYDPQRRLQLESYYGADEEPCLVYGGYAAVKRIYYEDGEEDGKLRRLEYRGTENELVTNQRLGYAAVEYKREIQGGQEMVREVYTGPEEELVMLPDLGCTAVERSYDTSGQLMSERYYNQDKPICRSDYGVFQILYEYGDDGNRILERYQDVSGRPVNRLDTGCAAIHWSFEKGRMTRKSYEGYRDGKLRSVAELGSGAASVSYQYENGRQVQVRFFGVQGEPVLRNEYGCASWRSEYENGLLSARYYYGLNEKLLARNDTGYAVIRYTYDSQGRRETIRYYGEKQEPVIHNEYACAGFKYEYDDAGNEWKVSFLGLDGECMLRGNGYGFAWTEKAYTDKGSLKSEHFFGLDLDLEKNSALWKERGYASYEFEFNDDGTKRESRFFDGEGNLTRRSDEGYAIVRYTYDEGRLRSERYYDENDHPVISPYYQCAGFFYEYDENGRKSLVRYLGLDGKALVRPDLGFAEKHIVYDSQGNVFSESYFAADGKTPAYYKGRGYVAFEDVYKNGHCVENRYYSLYEGEEKVLTMRTDRGYARATHEYNDVGLLKKTLYYNEKEAPVVSWNSRCAGFSYEYEQRNRESMVHILGTDGKPMLREGYCDAAIRKSYDGAGNLTGETYLDLKGNPIVWSKYGYASYTKVYQAGKLMETRYFDAQGNPVLKKDSGCAVITWDYDELGRESAKHYYGKDGEPVLNTQEHCAGFQYGYDDAWNRTDIFYLHPDGGVMIREDKGYANIHSEYNPLGEAEGVWYYADAEGKRPAVVKEGGFHHMQQKFAQGKCVMRVYFDDKEDYMARTDEGYAAYESSYNQFGQLVRKRYYGLAEEPGGEVPLVIGRSSGCAGFVYRYDERGNRTDTWCTAPDHSWMVQLGKGYAYVHCDYDELDHLKEERHYLDGDGTQPAVWIEGGYAWATFLHDAQGNLEEAAFFGPDDRPVLRNNYGAAKVKNEYDSIGNRLRTLYYGKEDEPICTSEWNCAGFQYEYDSLGNQTDTWYLGLDEKPMVRKDLGYAHIHFKYDEEGNEVQRQYFDAEEQPAYSKDGYSFVESRYQNGNCISWQYFDAAHRPIQCKEGYSARKVSFQEGFKETRYLNEESRLVLREGNYAILRQEYDDLGREISKVYLDKNERMILHETEGCAGYRYAYDDHGNRSDVWYLGLDGEPMNLEGQGVAHVHYVYNDAGQEREERFFNAEEQAVSHEEYGYAVKKSFYGSSNKSGKLERVQFMNTEESACLRKDTGCAEERYDYDEAGYRTSVWYYGLEGEGHVVHKTEGYAGVRYFYDERGNLWGTFYYGADREKAPRKGYGVSQNYRRYDNYNHLIWDSYYLWDKESGNRLTSRKDVGYAAIEYTYDRELLVMTSYLDANERPIICKGYSYAIVRREYDRNGQLERKCYFDEFDQLYDGLEEYSVEEYQYDNPSGVQKNRYTAEKWNNQTLPMT